MGYLIFSLISGLENISSVDERRPRLALYQEFMLQLGEEAPRAGWVISEVDLADTEDLKALLIRGQQTIQVALWPSKFSGTLSEFPGAAAGAREVEPQP